MAGHGTTTQAHDYQLVAPAIARYGTSLVYYRSRQGDLPGTLSYSPVRAAGQSALALFPNPTTGAATLVSTAAGAAAPVFDVVGWSRACTWCVRAARPCA